MTQRTRIKFCGLTRVEDVTLAGRLGVDAMGFVFYPPSSRAVTPEQAGELLTHVPPFVTSTGLFVDPEPDHVKGVLAQAPLDLLQFHGDETDAFCAQFGVPYIKAVRMHPEADLDEILARWPGARGLLLDAWHPDQPGGTGLTFDWSRIPVNWRERIVLAGGLTPDNVGSAIRQVRPYGVDVSGGIEAERGTKNSALMADFVAAVQQEDSTHD